MRGLALLTVIALVGCASGGATEHTQPDPGPERRIISAGGLQQTGALQPMSEPTSNVTHIAVPVAVVWPVLAVAYDSLKIPVTTSDSQAHHIGNPGLKVRRRLGLVALSRYLDCGMTAMGPNADSYDVFLNVTTTLKPLTETLTEISTFVEAGAKPLIGSTQYTRCSTNGQLEKTIEAILSAKLGRRVSH